MTPRVSFVPAGSVTLTVPNGSITQNFAMPAVDGANVDTTVTNNTGGTVWLAFAAGGAAGPQAAGCVTVFPGQTILLTSNAAVLAAAINALIQGGPQAAAAAATTTVSVNGQFGGSLIITRGAGSAVQSFA